MEWSEINWQESRWELPGAKMKMRLDHIVPLSKQAVSVLEEIHMHTGRGEYVFPSARGASRPLSENGVRTALRTMGYSNEQITPHGFRAMTRTILDEVLGYRVGWIEHQLAHAVKDPNGRAYNRTAHLEGRRKMMQGWAVTAYSARTRTHLELCGAVEPVSYGTVKTSSDGSTWADAGLGAFPKLFLFQ